MKTFSFFDHGLTPAFQCMVDAEDIDDAKKQVAALGFPLHRLSAILGVRIRGLVGEGPQLGLSFSLKRMESRAEALDRLFQAVAVTEVHRCTHLYYTAVDRSNEEVVLGQIEIHDLRAEFHKYNLPYDQ